MAGRSHNWPKTAAGGSGFVGQYELHRCSSPAETLGEGWQAAGLPPCAARARLWRRDDGQTAKGGQGKGEEREIKREKERERERGSYAAEWEKREALPRFGHGSLFKIGWGDKVGHVVASDSPIVDFFYPKITPHFCFNCNLTPLIFYQLSKKTF